MNLYETGFLLAPNLSDDESEKIIQQMAEVVAQKNGRMTRIDRWGKRKTAYPIGKFGEAAYVFFYYEGTPDIPLELQRRFKQTDAVLRYLTLNKDVRENVRNKRKAEAEARRRARSQAAASGEAPAAEAAPREEK
ncbi:MAG: 30S ribosomal protein S6 [Candidatus Aminicenantes bacterium]|nr:30S ribosomal protein S6 [Candidatus Aminicenantes bacterium]